jgi:hypothetical protein
VHVPFGWDSIFVSAADETTHYVAGQGLWDLTGPMDVVARDTVKAGGDMPYGTTGKVDLMIEGKTFTQATAPYDVSFGPEFPDSVNADDWGGLFLTADAAGSVISGASIGWARNPLFLSYPDSLTSVRESRIHHFRDIGIHVQGASGTGGVLYDNLVERGGNLDGKLGNIGIFLDVADEISVNSNTVDLSGLNTNEAGDNIGILTYFGKNYCEASPVEYDQFRLSSNDVWGPVDQANVTGEKYLGMRVHWVCGNEYFDATISDNEIVGWDTAGLDLLQISDVQITCNLVDETENAVNIDRDDEAEGPGIRFRENALVTLEVDAAVVRTNQALKTKLGGGVLQTDRGQNALYTAPLNAFFLFENDADSTRAVSAERNFWFTRDESDSNVLLGLESDVVARLAVEDDPADSAMVSITPIRTIVPTPAPCWSAYATSSTPMRPQGVLDAERPGTDPQRGEVDIPNVSSIGAFRPNPTSAWTRVDLAVGRKDAGLYTIRVYDVAGRRISEIEERHFAAGRYRVQFNVADVGIRAPGVYFVRVEGPGISKTRRLVVLR